MTSVSRLDLSSPEFIGFIRTKDQEVAADESLHGLYKVPTEEGDEVVCLAGKGRHEVSPASQLTPDVIEGLAEVHDDTLELAVFNSRLDNPITQNVLTALAVETALQLAEDPAAVEEVDVVEAPATVIVSETSILQMIHKVAPVRTGQLAAA